MYFNSVPACSQIPFSPEPLAGGEDPYIWKDAGNNFHVLFHAFDKARTPNGTMFPGSHAFSADGECMHSIQLRYLKFFLVHFPLCC